MIDYEKLPESFTKQWKAPLKCSIIIDILSESLHINYKTFPYK